MAWMPYLLQRNRPLTLTSNVNCQVSSLVLSGVSSSPGETPALLYKMSRPPQLSTAILTMASTWPASRTSTVAGSAVPPAAVIASTVSAAPSALLSATTTLAPSAANRWQAMRPMPAPPPVMMAILSSRRPIAVLLRG